MFLRGVLLLLFAFPATTFATEILTSLEAGKPVERRLAGDEVHSYRIDLLPHQYAEVVVDQRGIDLALRLYDLKGQARGGGHNQDW